MRTPTMHRTVCRMHTRTQLPPHKREARQREAAGSFGDMGEFMELCSLLRIHPAPLDHAPAARLISHRKLAGIACTWQRRTPVETLTPHGSRDASVASREEKEAYLRCTEHSIADAQL